MGIGLTIVFVLLAAVVVCDLVQTKHAILRNFPIIGHFRYLLEAVGPELRQYIVTNNDEERPFSRDQRRWVYASSKKQNNYFGFGTDNDMELLPNYLIVKQSAFGYPSPEPGTEGYDPEHRIPCAKVLGGFRQRRKAFRPESILYVSAMSFGSLSAAAVEAIDQGCARAGALHNTGEGGIAPFHDHGAGLIYQLVHGYFGSRDEHGRFDLERCLATIAAHDVRAIEIKLSQGAKPGRGGVLPAAKVTPQIAEIRGVPVGRDVISPANHTAFHDPDSLLDFVELLADRTGLPVGIKSAIGDLSFWEELCRQMATTGRAIDFLTIDGGEGGTGAAPLVFSDHVSLPFKLALTRVFPLLVRNGLDPHIVVFGSGKLGFPQSALLAMALGCDMIGVAREAMLAIGCIQAQPLPHRALPTGVATQNRWLMHGLDPTHKGHRLANYLVALRKEIEWLAHACGQPHPALVTPDQLEILDHRFSGRSAREVFGYEMGWGLPGAADQQRLRTGNPGVRATE